MLTAPTHGLADDVGRLLGPDKGCGVCVPMRYVVFDMAHEGTDGWERSAAHRFTGQNSEPRFDHVQPGRAGRCEVEADFRMSVEPSPYLGGGVRRGVVEDDVQLTPSVAPVQPLEEAQEVDRKSTRLNSSHGYISYAVFCLKKKKKQKYK